MGVSIAMERERLRMNKIFSMRLYLGSTMILSSIVFYHYDGYNRADFCAGFIFALIITSFACKS